MKEIFVRKINKEQKAEETSRGEKEPERERTYENKHEGCFLNFLKV